MRGVSERSAAPGRPPRWLQPGTLLADAPQVRRDAVATGTHAVGRTSRGDATARLGRPPVILHAQDGVGADVVSVVTGTREVAGRERADLARLARADGANRVTAG